MSTWKDELPKRAAAHVCVPRVNSSCLLLLWETLQDQQLGLTQATFKLLLLPWVPEHVRFCVCPIEVQSLFPKALWVLESKSHWASKPNILAALFPAQDPQAGQPDVGLRQLAPWGEPLQL